MSWIKCSERMPGLDTCTLCCNQYGHVMLLRFDSCKFNKRPVPKWKHRDGRLPHGTITHWMPLPEPPNDA